MNRFDKPLTPKEIAVLKDTQIDFSDIPELDTEFWKNAEQVEPDRTEQITIRLKRPVIEYFKGSGTKGYQTRITQLLESHVRAHRGADQ